MDIFSKPYFTSLVHWGTSDISDPKTKPVIACDIGTDIFRKRTNIVAHFKTISDGSLWWEEGLQAWVVHILTDNLDEGVYCGYCAMNDPKYFKLLGKLKDGDKFTEEARKVLASYEA
jgi:hypothetical protein